MQSKKLWKPFRTTCLPNFKNAKIAKKMRKRDKILEKVSGRTGNKKKYF